MTRLVRTGQQHQVRLRCLKTGNEVRRFGIALADFHAGAARAPAASPWGGAAAIGARTGADLAEVAALLAPDSPAIPDSLPTPAWS